MTSNIDNVQQLVCSQERMSHTCKSASETKLHTRIVRFLYETWRKDICPKQGPAETVRPFGFGFLITEPSEIQHSVLSVFRHVEILSFNYITLHYITSYLKWPK